MKQFEEERTYEAPEMEVIEVALEQGFAQTGGKYPGFDDEKDLFPGL